MIPKSRFDNALGGPYLTQAVFCERCLVEKDNVQSMIRVFDTWNVRGPAGKIDPDAKTEIQATFVVAFKSGDFKGSKVLTFTGREVDDYRPHISGPPNSVDLTFLGGEQGPIVIATVSIQVPLRSMTLWFDVALDGQLYSRIPLRVLVQQTEEGTQSDLPERKQHGPLKKKPPRGSRA